MRTPPLAGGLVVAVLALLFTAAPAGAQSFTDAGDKDAGLAFTGDSFDDAFLRYYLNPRLGIQAGLGFSRESQDIGPDTNAVVTAWDFEVGALYEICGGERHRGYVLPSLGYSTMDVGPVERSGFNFGFALGGDVKMTDHFMLGLQGGLRFSSYSDEFGDTDVGDGNSLTIGNTNRLNLTLRFPHGD
jgi:hypothetical protein